MERAVGRRGRWYVAPKSRLTLVGEPASSRWGLFGRRRFVLPPKQPNSSPGRGPLARLSRNGEGEQLDDLGGVERVLAVLLDQFGDAFDAFDERTWHDVVGHA